MGVATHSLRCVTVYQKLREQSEDWLTEKPPMTSGMDGESVHGLYLSAIEGKRRQERFLTFGYKTVLTDTRLRRFRNCRGTSNWKTMSTHQCGGGIQVCIKVFIS